MLRSVKNKILFNLFSILAFAQSALAANAVFPGITYQSLQTSDPIIINKNLNSSAINKLLSIQELLSQVQIINDSVLTINNNQFYAYITTDTDGGGQVDFKSNGAISSSLGSPNYKIGLVNFVNNAKIYGNSYVKIIEIAPNTTVTFNNNIKAEPGDDQEFTTTRVEGGIINLTGVRATVVFGDGTYVGSNIETDFSGQGSVRATGNVFLNKIGSSNNRIDRLNFYEPNTIAKLNDDIFAKTMDVDKVALDINKNLILDITNFTAADNTIKLNANTLTVRGNFKLAEETVINIKIVGDNLGNIVVDGPNSELDLSSTALVINLTPGNVSVLSQNGTTKAYPIFNSTNGGTIIPTDQSSLQISGPQNRYIKWSYEPTLYTIFLENNLNNFVSDIQNSGANPLTVDFARTLANDPNLSSDALLLLNTAANMNSNEAATLLDNVVPKLLTSQETVDENNTQISKNYAYRLSTILDSFEQKIFHKNNGVAGGDEANKYGAWFAPFYSQSIQKARKLNDGYKTHSYGATLGFDAKLNETLTLGFGASHIHSAIKNNRDYVQDKGKVNSYIFSLYGRFDLPRNWFVQGIASYGKSFIENTETRKVTDSIMELAKAKHKIDNYSTQLLLGNDYQITEFAALTPMVGLRYDRFNSCRYKETGTSNENLSVYKKPVNRIEGIIGGKINASFNVDKLTVKPMIQGLVNNNFNNKKPVTITTLDGLSSPLPSRAEKPEKLSYDLGIGINMEYKNLEFGVIHDIEFERKFVAHQTMLKLKVNF